MVNISNTRIWINETLLSLMKMFNFTIADSALFSCLIQTGTVVLQQLTVRCARGYQLSFGRSQSSSYSYARFYFTKRNSNLVLKPMFILQSALFSLKLKKFFFYQKCIYNSNLVLNKSHPVRTPFLPLCHHVCTPGFFNMAIGGQPSAERFFCLLMVLLHDLLRNLKDLRVS